MNILEIRGDTGRSQIHIGRRLEFAAELLKERRTAIITDENVKRLYGHRFPGGDVITIGTGEEIKTLETVEHIYSTLLKQEYDRSCFILGIGGGIVCDVAGFAASTYLRGLDFGFIASTLLAQADASAGGKNGVNFRGYKNMVGVFSQPEFVICDPEMLQTLPEQELKTGFAEVIKHALIGDPTLMEFLEQNGDRALGLDPGVIKRITGDALKVKSELVNADEREAGQRRILNFGHTLAHAFETTAGLTHGEAVAAGMGVAAKLSVQRAGLSNSSEKRIYELLKKFDLNREIRFSGEAIKNAVRKDKKRERDHIHFVLLEEIGLEGDRVRMYNLSSGEGPTFAAYAKEMTEHIKALGPNRLNSKATVKN